MANPIFSIKRGDTDPSLKAICEPRDKVDFSGVTEVKFFMQNLSDGALIINGVAGYVVQPSNPPILGYDWQVADTAVAMDCRAEFQVTYANGRKGTFPNDDEDDILVEISQDLGD